MYLQLIKLFTFFAVFGDTNYTDMGLISESEITQSQNDFERMNSDSLLTANATIHQSTSNPANYELITSPISGTYSQSVQTRHIESQNNYQSCQLGNYQPKEFNLEKKLTETWNKDPKPSCSVSSFSSSSHEHSASSIISDQYFAFPNNCNDKQSNCPTDEARTSYSNCTQTGFQNAASNHQYNPRPPQYHYNNPNNKPVAKSHMTFEPASVQWPHSRLRHNSFSHYRFKYPTLPVSAPKPNEGNVFILRLNKELNIKQLN